MRQERGFELLEALYSKAHRLNIVQVLTYMYGVPRLTCDLVHLVCLSERVHCVISCMILHWVEHEMTG